MGMGSNGFPSTYSYNLCIMKGKENKSITGRPKNYFYGAFKGEIKRVKGLWNRTTSIPHTMNNQVDTVISRRICCPIPKDQDRLAAKARGEEQDRSFYNPVLNVRIL